MLKSSPSTHGIADGNDTCLSDGNLSSRRGHSTDAGFADTDTPFSALLTPATVWSKLTRNFHTDPTKDGTGNNSKQGTLESVSYETARAAPPLTLSQIERQASVDEGQGHGDNQEEDRIVI